MHTSSRSLRTVLAACALAAAIVPGPAGAQIGGFIKKKVGDRIADKVLGEQQGSPKFTGTVLEIDGDRLDQLIRGIDAEVAARDAAMKPFSTYEAEKAAWERKQAEMVACHERAGAAYNAAAGGFAARPMAAPDPAMIEFQRRMMALPEKDREALQERMQKTADAMDRATARGDTVEAARLALAGKADVERTVGMPMPVPSMQNQPSQSEIAKVTTGAERMQADMAKCGTTLPAPPTPPAGYANARELVRDSIKVAAVRASGLEEAQYAAMRERVTAWLAVRSGKPAAGYVFTREETAALEARAGELAAREKALLGEDLPAGWRI